MRTCNGSFADICIMAKCAQKVTGVCATAHDCASCMYACENELVFHMCIRQGWPSLDCKASKTFLSCSLVEGELLDDYMGRSLASKAPQQHVQTVLQMLKKVLQVCLLSWTHDHCYSSVMSVCSDARTSSITSTTSLGAMQHFVPECTCAL